MNTPVLAMVVVLLFLLFFKVPVFASVLGASAVYFVLNPNVNPLPYSPSRPSPAPKASRFSRSPSLSAPAF